MAGTAGATPTISGLTASPSHITPNGDGVTDSTQVSFTPGGAGAQVDIRVDIYELAGGTLLTTLLPDSAVSTGALFSVSWAPAPLSVPDGDYRFDVLVVDAPDSLTQSVTVTVDIVAPTVAFGSVGPNPFDPGALPPQSLSVPVTVIGMDASTFVRIVQDSTEVDSLGTVVGADSTTLSWAGNNYAGNAAASGWYEVVAVASDLAGNAHTARISVARDSDAPVFADSDPDTIQTDSILIDLSDNEVTDTHQVETVMLSVDAGSTWVAPVFQSPPGPSVDWNTDISIPAGPADHYEILVRAVDYLGSQPGGDERHRTDVTYVVAYDSVLPVPTGTSVLGGAVRDGEWVRLRTDWNLPGLTVTADFRALDFGYSTGDEMVTEDSPRSYLVEYRVTPSNIRSTGEYSVVVTASTGIVSAPDTVMVDLVATSLGSTELVAINANRFDPDAGETVTFAGDRATMPLRIDIFNLAGQPIRELEGNGFLEWDGRTESGRVVASGMYFLRVRSEGAEKLRKVAVLRGGGS